MTAADDNSNPQQQQQQQPSADSDKDSANTNTNNPSAAAPSSSSTVSASSSHPNLLALLDAASRVETLPVPSEAEDGKQEAAGEETNAAEAQDGNDVKMSEQQQQPQAQQQQQQALPKTNALTAEMVRELTAQKAAALSGVLNSSTNPVSTGTTSSPSSNSNGNGNGSSPSSAGTGSKLALAAKKSTYAKFKAKRPKLPISTAQPRLAGSAEADMAASAAAAAAAGATPTATATATANDPTATGSRNKLTYRKVPKPVKLEPVQKDTFPVILYRVLMASSESEEDNNNNGGDDDKDNNDHGEAAGENPSEQPKKNSAKTTKKGYDDIVHWLPEGTHFVIVDTDRFVKEVMAKEFGVSQKLTSFTRRLSRWGFQQVRVPGFAQHMAFCHPKFRRGDKDAVYRIKSVQAEQGARNAASAEKLGLARAAATHTALMEVVKYREQNPIIPSADSRPGAVAASARAAAVATATAATAGLPYHASDPLLRSYNYTAADLRDPIVAARVRAAAALEVEEETLRIQHLERQLQIQQVQAAQAQAEAEAQAQTAAAVAAVPYDSYVGVGAGAPHSGLQSLAARNAASALTRRYSGTGSSLAAIEAAAGGGGAAAGVGANGYGQSLADMHYAQAAQGLPLNAAAAPAPTAGAAGLHHLHAHEAGAAAGTAAVGAVDLAQGPPSIFGQEGQIYEQSSPLEREILLQARYKHLLNLQASLQRKALVSQQHQLQLEEQQYLAAHNPHAALGVGAGIAGAGHAGQLLPQDAVDSATRNVLAGAAAVMQRDSLLSGPAAGAPGYPYL